MTYPFSESHEVSDCGDVRRVVQSWSHTPRVISGWIQRNGYRQVCLRQDGVKLNISVHRLVALAFTGPCPASKEVNHIDGCKLNNCDTNLEYITRRENILHSHRLGFGRVGEDHGMAKLTVDKVIEYRRRWSLGEKPIDLAIEAGMSKSGILSALRGTTWRFVT
jgi:hypothetical protein